MINLHAVRTDDGGRVISGLLSDSDVDLFLEQVDPDGSKFYYTEVEDESITTQMTLEEALEEYNTVSRMLAHIDNPRFLRGKV